jgi:hypothetical protein
VCSKPQRLQTPSSRPESPLSPPPLTSPRASLEGTDVGLSAAPLQLHAACVCAARRAMVPVDSHGEIMHPVIVQHRAHAILLLSPVTVGPCPSADCLVLCPVRANAVEPALSCMFHPHPPICGYNAHIRMYNSRSSLGTTMYGRTGAPHISTVHRPRGTCMRCIMVCIIRMRTSVTCGYDRYVLHITSVPWHMMYECMYVLFVCAYVLLKKSLDFGSASVAGSTTDVVLWRSSMQRPRFKQRACASP